MGKKLRKIQLGNTFKFLFHTVHEDCKAEKMDKQRKINQENPMASRIADSKRAAQVV